MDPLRLLDEYYDVEDVNKLEELDDVIADLQQEMNIEAADEFLAKGGLEPKNQDENLTQMTKLEKQEDDLGDKIKDLPDDPLMH